MCKRWGGVWAAWIVLLGLALPLRAPVAADPPGPAVGALLPPLMREWTVAIEPCYAGCGGALAPAVNEAYEQQVVELVNVERAARGLPPLKRTAGLTGAARYHAVDMGQDDYFDHDTYDRYGEVLARVCDPWSRIGSYTAGACGENVGAGFEDPAQVMAAWMASGGHQDNILNTDSWELGVGYYAGGGWGHYWTLDLGRQAGIYPLVINQEAARCDSEQVSLYVYGTWDEIRLRNDGGPWSDWLPFQNTLSWMLQGSVGERTVEAEMRGPAGSAASSDTIVLTQVTSPKLGNLPQTLTFFYSIPEGRLMPPAAVLAPANTATGEALSWRVEQTGTWYSAGPTSGTTPEALTIVPAGFDTGSPGTYSGEVVVTVTAPGEVQGSPHTIALSLQVIDGPLQRVYLPLTLRAD